MINSDGMKTRMVDYEKIDKELRPKFPKNMLIELTNMCNHNCIFCANSKMTRKKGIIDESFLYRILEEAFVEGTTEVGFYATGEPLMIKDLPKYVAKAKAIGYKYVYITTNGSLAVPERAIEIIKAGIDSIKFSINAATKNTYKLIHGKDDFEKVIDNVKFISKYRKETNQNYKIYVSYISTKYSDDEKIMLQEVLKDCIDEIIFLDVRNQGGMMYEVNKYLVLDGNKEVVNNNYAPCPLPFKSLHITYEGYLTACCIDFQNYLTVADLNLFSLKDAWNSDEIINLRRMHLKNSLQGTLCYNCIYNKNEEIQALISEHSTYFDKDNFNKEDEVKKRILYLEE